jgi:hypothetical protein
MSLIPIVQGGHSTASGFDSTLIGNSAWYNGTDSRMDSPSFSAQSDPTCFTFATWVQINAFSVTNNQYIWSAERSGNYAAIGFDANDKLFAYSNPATFTSDMKFRDIGWYHIICSYKGATNTVRMFCNGVEITNSTSSSLASPNPEPVAHAHTHRIGSYYVGATGGDLYEANSYLAQTVFLDGFSFQDGDVTVSDFLDTFTFGTNGSQFIPKKDSELATLAGTAGANSYVLDYANSSALGNDISSKDNNFTLTNLSSSNQSSNTPSKVYSTWNPIQHPFPTTSGSLVAPTLTEGNLRAAISSGNRGAAISSLTIPAGSGKFAAKFTVNTVGGIYPVIGVYDVEGSNAFTNGFTATSDSVGLRMDGQKYVDGSSSSYGSSVSATNTVEVELDMDNNTVEFLINGSAQGTISKTFAGRVGFMIEDGTSSGAIDVTAEFDYTPNDSNFLTLNSANLTAPTHQGCDAFSAVTYTGNGSTRSITTDIAPAWVWIKNRSQGDEHKLVDIVRGVQKELSSDDASNAEQTDSNGVTAFSSSSFSLGSGANGYNDNTENFIAWCWAAGTAFSNDASATGIGTLDSSGRVNASDSLSIVSYTGSGSNAAIKHGLSAAPNMYWVRNRDAGNDWNVYADGTDASPASGSLRLDSGAGFNSDATVWNGVPSSTVINLGTSDETNKLNDAFVAFCFRSVPGVSKIGTYVGNGSGSGTADGPYVSTGFRPAIVFQKWVTGGSLSGENWVVKDTARQPLNENRTDISPSSAGAESTGATHGVDILADGFKLRGGGGANNKSEATYLFAAFSDLAGNGALPPIFGR